MPPGEEPRIEDADADAVRLATHLIDELQRFAAALEPRERELLAALLAPGVAAAWGEPAEVDGFQVAWSPDRLPTYLADAVRDRDLRITGW